MKIYPSATMWFGIRIGGKGRKVRKFKVGKSEIGKSLEKLVRVEPVLSTFFTDSFIHKNLLFGEKSILSTFGNFAQNTVLSTLFANETLTHSFRKINHSSL